MVRPLTLEVTMYQFIISRVSFTATSTEPVIDFPDAYEARAKAPKNAARNAARKLGFSQRDLVSVEESSKTGETMYEYHLQGGKTRERIYVTMTLESNAQYVEDLEHARIVAEVAYADSIEALDEPIIDTSKPRPNTVYLAARQAFRDAKAAHLRAASLLHARTH